MINDFITTLLGTIDPAYFLSVIILSFITIQWYFKKKSRNCKQMITAIIGIVLAIIYYFTIGIGIDKIIPTFGVAVVSYDYIVKKIINMMKKSDENK